MYVTTNLINGKKYVGDHSTYNINDNYLGSGRPYFKNALKKYSRKNFEREILEQFKTKKEAFDAQERYINKYNTLVPNGYNISPKGGNGVSGCFSQETIEKIRKSNIGKNKGKKASRETKEKIIESLKGRIPTNETRLKLSKKLKNRKFSEETKGKMRESKKGKTPWNKGLKMRDEYKRKLSLSHKTSFSAEEKEKKYASRRGRTPWNKGVAMTEETRKKLSYSLKGRIPWNKGLKSLSD